MSENPAAPQFQDLVAETGGEPDEAHDRWARTEIENALAAKRDGRSTYRTLCEVAAKYPIDAR
ncbi:MAG: hypothetical protein AAFR11_05315 [Pseudomonadota bacterium]